jgi:hypothetical protein
MEQAVSDELEPRVNTEGIVIGAVIMLLGGTIMLDRAGIIHVYGRFVFWPFVLITLGLIKLSKRRDDGRREGGWWVFLGVWLLLNDVGVLAFRTSWPLILVAVGGSIVWNALHPRAPRPRRNAENS